MIKTFFLVFVVFFVVGSDVLAQTKEPSYKDLAIKRPSAARISTQSVQNNSPTTNISKPIYTTTHTYTYDASMSIFGEPMISQGKATAYLKSTTPNAKLNCSIEEIVSLYYKEAAKEGIRADVALSQAIVETGYFLYGGTVVPEQNNYCGLGTTSAIVKGEWFKSPELGVRAHIQHLLVYASKREPKEAIVDPRFGIIQKMPHLYGTARNWMDLDGRWATAPNYGHKILTIHSKMNNFAGYYEETKVVTNPTTVSKPEEQSIVDRIQNILKGVN